MDTAATIRPSTYMRVATALALSIVCVLLVTLLLNTPVVPATARDGSGRTAAREAIPPAMQKGRVAHMAQGPHRTGAGQHGTPTGTGRASLIRTLSLLSLALATYAWFLYPAAGSLLISAAVLVVLLWAWAAQQGFGLQPAVLGLLAGAAAWQCRRRSRQFHRMQQLLDDLGEERGVKDQTIELTRQTREALQKKLSRYTQLQQIAESLSHMTDVAAITQLAVSRSFTLIGKSDVCLLFLLDPERQALSLFASEKRRSIPSVRAKHGDQFDRYVLRTHAPLLVNDARRDFRFTVTASPERTISSVIACPLFLGQSPAGVLRLDSAQPAAYTQDDLRFLDILLNLVATAITNARLFARTQQLAMTDGLTGLMLRRPFLEQLARELIRSTRSREPISVLMVDVDHFKQYNDTFGHTAGDLILKHVAKVLLEAVPAGGLVARYGGEEFVILLSQVPRPQAHDVAEKIRQLVERQVQGSGWGVRPPMAPALSSSPPAVGSERRAKDRPDGEESRGREAAPAETVHACQTGPGAVTVSVGVASFPADAQAELELIRIADQRLYQAKRDGRNRVISS